jgi:transcription initiation factor IIE alpha subunit
MQDTSAVEEVQTLYRTYYECSECGTKWTSESGWQDNDTCPKCCCEIEPFDSVEI